METNYLIYAQLTFIFVSIGLTLIVAHKLYANSILFMVDIFHGKIDIAQSTNNLFKIGFYLLNIGIALWINDFFNMSTIESLVEELSQKIGAFCVFLGVMLFFNLLLFLRGRKHANATTIKQNTSVQ